MDYSSKLKCYFMLKLYNKCQIINSKNILTSDFTDKGVFQFLQKKQVLLIQHYSKVNQVNKNSLSHSV
jgi:hypothetical protein